MKKFKNRWIRVKFSSSHVSLKVAFRCCLACSRRILIQEFVCSTSLFAMLSSSRSFK